MVQLYLSHAHYAEWLCQTVQSNHFPVFLLFSLKRCPAKLFFLFFSIQNSWFTLMWYIAKNWPQWKALLKWHKVALSEIGSVSRSPGSVKNILNPNLFLLTELEAKNLLLYANGTTNRVPSQGGMERVDMSLSPNMLDNHFITLIGKSERFLRDSSI